MQPDIIQNALMSLGMSPNAKGFTYIVDAVQLLDKPEWKQPKWCALYHAIATLNNTSQACVEANIRVALRGIRENNTGYDQVNHYLGYCHCDNSSSLMQLYTRLKQEEKKDASKYNKALIKQALRELLIDI